MCKSTTNFPIILWLLLASHKDQSWVTFCFNLYVVDMQSNTNVQDTCLQYAHDSTIYQHCRVNELGKCKSTLEDTLLHINTWSINTNLSLSLYIYIYSLVLVSWLGQELSWHFNGCLFLSMVIGENHAVLNYFK